MEGVGWFFPLPMMSERHKDRFGRCSHSQGAFFIPHSANAPRVAPALVMGGSILSKPPPSASNHSGPYRFSPVLQNPDTVSTPQSFSVTFLPPGKFTHPSCPNSFPWFYAALPHPPADPVWGHPRCGARPGRDERAANASSCLWLLGLTPILVTSTSFWFYYQMAPKSAPCRPSTTPATDLLRWAGTRMVLLEAPGQGGFPQEVQLFALFPPSPWP